MLIDTDIAFHAYGKSSRHRTLPMVDSPFPAASAPWVLANFILDCQRPITAKQKTDTRFLCSSGPMQTWPAGREFCEDGIENLLFNSRTRPPGGWRRDALGGHAR